MLKGKNIILGVCGSIACYKAAYLIRLLVKAGAEVRVVMTEDAKNFITPLTLSTLSKKPVLVKYFKEETGEWNQHVELGLWADILLVAPATANTLAKMANGLCDNLLSAIYLSARCPVYFSPAMDLDMWKHPSTEANVQKLISYGNELIAPQYGELASGLIGEGRMAEPEDILAYLLAKQQEQLPLNGKNAVVTAGPTYEAIDPVRFIGNHSSGKMGFALAEELRRLGANVILITGPTALKTENQIDRIDVTSASEMLEACKKHFDQTDIFIMSAAVADYTPISVASQKIKKNSESFELPLKRTEDILAYLGKIKKPKQLLVGFALETEHEKENALIKLKKKNLDFIVLNSLNETGAGFKSDTNKITIIDRQQHQTKYPLKTKDAVAKDICLKVLELVT